MLKRNLILYFLIFFYAIVLGHSAIPHGHFDELFHAEHEHDSQEHNDHDHHFLFSHSISLHVAIEKQAIFSAYPFKSTTKNAQLDSLFYHPAVFGLYGFKSPFILLRFFKSKSPILVWFNSIANRGPPAVS